MLSLSEIAVWLGFELSEHLFVEIFPVDENTCVLRFADTVTYTCIYYKFERFIMISGGIIMWHGLIANIPPDYALCDGNNGTPDLRDRFVVGAADAVEAGGVGGSINHNHDFTGDGHFHTVAFGTGIAGGPNRSIFTTPDPTTGTTDNEDGRPPYYDILFIMKL